MVICPGDLPSAALSNGSEHFDLQKVRTATLGDRTVVTLWKLEQQATGPSVTAVVAETGQQLVAVSAGAEWQGAVRSLDNGVYTVDPGFSLPAAVGVFLSSDKTGLVGVSAEVGGKVMVIPMTEVIKKLPEIGGP
jgi:hypothetical protein